MKKLEQYESLGNKNCLLNVITKINPDIIEGEILTYLTENEITSKVDDNKYKIKFDFEAKIDNLKNVT